jgi:spermidine/putrescine transport system permease protein
MAERSFSATRLPGFSTIAILVFAGIYLPIAVIVIYSFNASNSLASWGGLSWKWYVAAWSNQEVQEAALRSFVIALIAAISSAIVAHRSRGRR